MLSVYASSLPIQDAQHWYFQGRLQISFQIDRFEVSLPSSLFLDTQVSLAPTHLRCPSVRHTFEFPFYQRLWLLYVKI